MDDGIERKPTRPYISSNPGFYREAGPVDWLRTQGVTAITVMGVATDYCVKFTVLDAIAEGFAVTLHLPGCRGVDLQEGDCEKAIEKMREAGASTEKSLRG